jgi:hypothetical protein
VSLVADDDYDVDPGYRCHVVRSPPCAFCEGPHDPACEWPSTDCACTGDLVPAIVRELSPIEQMIRHPELAELNRFLEEMYR